MRSTLQQVSLLVGRSLSRKMQQVATDSRLTLQLVTNTTPIGSRVSIRFSCMEKESEAEDSEEVWGAVLFRHSVSSGRTVSNSTR